MPTKKYPLPSAEQLWSKFDYCPVTGILRSKKTGHAYCARQPNGYVQVRVGKIRPVAHRIIWKMMMGRDPADEIDHRDFNRANNKWNNLREATRSQNSHYRCVTPFNMTGQKGVRPLPGGRFMAHIRDDRGKQRYLGSFDRAEQAHAAYLAAARARFRDFAAP